MKCKYLYKNSPVGMDISSEIKFFLVALLIAVLYSFSFVIRFFEAFDSLYDTVNGKKVLDIYSVMPSFRSLLGNALIGFLVAALCMIGLIIHRYAYYRQGSRSVYLMKRLPNKGLLHKTAIKLPVIGMLLYLICAVIMFILYIIFYDTMTPKPCLVTVWQQFLWGI